MLLAVCALLLQGLLDATRAPVKQKDYELKISAARQAEKAFLAVREFRQLADARLDLVNDPAGTGLIGPEFSLITNARGDLDAKMTSLNPNFAGVLVQYFRQAGLRAGDKVAVAVSGSFPGMNIALYAAMETLQLDPVIITSVGASMWGANSPEFTWLDMERLFAEEGIFTLRSRAATFGGGNDMGRGLSPSGRELLQAAIERNEIPLLDSDNIQDAIDKRQGFFLTSAGGKPFSAYVNVGGGVASIGSSHNRLLLPSGLSFNLGEHNWPRKGNLIQFAEMGVPIIHLLRITDLARENGLPVAPDYLPVPGEGEIFVRTMYRLPLAMAMLAVYCLLCVLVLAPEIRQGIFDRLTRRPGRPPSPMVILAFAVTLSLWPTLSAQAATRWVSTAPRTSGGQVCLRSSGQDFNYQVLEAENPAVFEVTGPRKIKVVSRYLFGTTDQPPTPYTLIVQVDGAEVLRKTIKAVPHSEISTCSSAEIVSSLRRAELKLAKGKHEISLTATSDGQGKVAIRLFEETRKKSTATVPFQPGQYLEVATLQFESGNQSTYYRFESEHPLEFTLNGPTTVQLFTRLDFDLTMNGVQEYGIEVVRDGVPWRTFQFHTSELSSAHYLERPEVLPGSRKKTLIEVPPGRHVFQVRCLRPSRCGLAAQIMIPRKALEARP
jgi:poly-gamma-glutamate system protein